MSPWPDMKPATADATDAGPFSGSPVPDGPGDKDRLAVFLHPGRLFATAEPTTLRIILGSCVAVCLWDPVRRAGGANHFLLPYHSQDDPRFGNVAVLGLIERLMGLGCTKPRLQAKLFGGSCVLEAFQGKESHLGSRNVSVARELLAHEGIPVVAEDVGGQKGRRVIFQTEDGSAWVRRL